MHDGNLLLHELDSLWEKYQKRLTDCHHEASEEAVHKLRISTRRLLSSIELLQALAPQRELRKLRKALKGELDSFDELRDTQVMLLEITSQSDTLPQLKPFLFHLQTNEQRLMAQTPAIIESIKGKKLQRLTQKAHHHLHSELGKTNLKTQILAIIDNSYHAAMARYQQIDIAQPATIHRTRIGMKKFRYMLEAGQLLLPALPKNHLKWLRDYLTSMGEIQDSNVLLVSLKHFFADQVPLPVQTYYQHRHSTILSTYISRREEIRQFWRPDADQPFPWELARYHGKYS